TPGSVGSRYVLITECLQNDLFLNRECRLSLPDAVVRTMLLGKKRFDEDLGTASRRSLPSDQLEAGPLGRFLAATVGRRMSGEDGHRRRDDKDEEPDDVLDVINIRDWHVEDDNYDAERKRYGAHCERGTWGAAYIEGLEDYLDPGGRQAGD